MPLATEVIYPVVVNVVQEEQNRPKSGRRARKRFLSQKWWYCLLFQLFAAISPKFIFRVELEMLLGKRRTAKQANRVGALARGKLGQK